MRFDNFVNESASRVTMLQETLFAVGLAIYQSKGKISKELILDGNIFESSYNRFVDSDTLSNDVYEFALSNDSFVDSVVKSVNVLKSSPYSPPNSSVIYRTNGIMREVYKQASILLHKENIKLNPDKWNPGDVWTSTLTSLPSFDTIYKLNNFVREGIQKKFLIPISLKKSKNPKVVYNKQDDDFVIPTYKGVKRPTTPFRIGIIISTSDPKLSIDLRSFSQHKAQSITAELQIIGSSARHGKSTPSPFIKQYNIPQTSLSDFRKNADNTDIMVDMILRLWSDIGYSYNKSSVQKEWKERENDKEFIRNPAGYWRSIINALEFGVFLEKHKGVSDIIVQGIIKGCMSSSDVSSDFIKIY